MTQHDSERIFEFLNQGAQQLRELGVDYGDLRAVRREQEWLEVRNEALDKASLSTEFGVGVRALVGNSWAFCASVNVSAAGVRQCVEQAVAIARAAAPGARRSVHRGPPSAQIGEWATPVDVDPFGVSTEEKIDLLMRLSGGLKGRPYVVQGTAAVISLRTETWLASTEGTRISQVTTQCGGGMNATATRNGETQQRSYPKHFEGTFLGGGWERIEALAFDDHVERVAAEAAELCIAPLCPTMDDATLILDGSILGLQVHESCGHPTELDRALGEEISLAGSSFLTPDRLDAGYRYGSDLVTLYADGTTPGGAGTFGWDDEGTPARRTDLVKNGRFVGYLSGKEAAQRIGHSSAASFRSSNWYHVPIVRMVNVNLEPGSWRFEDLLADSDGAFWLSGPKSWSIDDLRLNFQFGCEVAREVKGGKLGRLYRNPVYTGISPRFWGGCDAICDQDSWGMWGFLFCGKGDPVQAIHVGHGVSPARFRGVRIGANG